MKKRFLIVLGLFLVGGVVYGQQMQPGATETVQDIFSSKVLKDGTTSYTKVDTVNKTYVGTCDLCGGDLFLVWKQSEGFNLPNVLGYKFHPVCFGKMFDYLKKKIKFQKIQ